MNSILSIYRPMGISAMLSSNDGVVVSPDLVICRPKHLEVICASVLPLQPPRHINAIAQWTAEIAAARILYYTHMLDSEFASDPVYLLKEKIGFHTTCEHTTYLGGL